MVRALRPADGAQQAPLQSFGAVARADARVLVLGSMPGARSLQLQQYYGHPQNAFWKIMGRLFGFDAASMPYEQRLAALQDCGVALWDVLARCERTGSLDSAIVEDSMVANDFAAFFAAHPAIVRVCFNGAKAAQVFQRHVAAGLVLPRPIAFVRLPSTSPAHAGMPLDAKLAAWQAVMP